MSVRKKTTFKKASVAIAFVTLIVTGCRMYQTNNAVIKEISQLEGKYNKNVLHDREVFFKQQELRQRLVERGFLERKEFLIRGCHPQTTKFREIIESLESKLQEGGCRAGLVEVKEYEVRTDDPITVVIWDRPNSMKAWELFINALELGD